MSYEDIYCTINNGCLFGIEYSRENDVGHIALGVGYAMAPNHEQLVAVNDPYGGEQKIKSYNEVLTDESGRQWTKSIEGTRRK